MLLSFKKEKAIPNKSPVPISKHWFLRIMKNQAVLEKETMGDGRMRYLCLVWWSF